MLFKHLVISKFLLKNNQQIPKLKCVRLSITNANNKKISHKLSFILLILLTGQKPQLHCSEKRNATIWSSFITQQKRGQQLLYHLFLTILIKKIGLTPFKYEQRTFTQQIFYIQNCVIEDFDKILDSLGFELNLFNVRLICLFKSPSYNLTEFFLRYNKLPILGS